MLSAGAGGSELITPDGSLVFILILFIVFVFVLNRVLFRPVGKVLDERETLTEGAKAEARAAAGRYDSRLAEYEAAVRQARADSYRFLEQQRAAALEERNRVIEAAKQRASDELNSAKAEIAGQASQAKAALESEAREIARQISQNLLGRTVGGGGH
jgi:F-type H+-transporting ATPase subunit b